MGVPIEAAVIDSMVEHAEQEAPLECCGLLMGQAGRITRLRRMQNLARSPFATRWFPGSCFSFSRICAPRASSISESTIPIPLPRPFHRLPISPRPFYPDCIYFILSLLAPGRPCLRAFSILDGFVAERAIERI